MVSETDICNLALTRFGDRTITSLTENSKAARLCALHYPRSRDMVLRAHPWNFAVKRKALSLSTTTPAYEFTSQFALPVDCLRVIRTGWDAASLSVEYRIEGRNLLCSESEAIIEYVARIEDPTQFDHLFIDVLSARLAAEICMAMTDNAGMTKNLWDIYQVKLGDARSTDAMEGTPREIVDASDWIIARL